MHDSDSILIQNGDKTFIKVETHCHHITSREGRAIMNEITYNYNIMGKL
jgi:hypothetical protein